MVAVLLIIVVDVEVRQLEHGLKLTEVPSATRMSSRGVGAPQIALADGLDVELQVPEIITKVARARGVLQGQRMR